MMIPDIFNCHSLFQNPEMNQIAKILDA